MSLGVHSNAEALAQMSALDTAHLVRRSEPHLLAAISGPRRPFFVPERKDPREFGNTDLLQWPGPTSPNLAKLGMGLHMSSASGFSHHQRTHLLAEKKTMKQKQSKVDDVLTCRPRCHRIWRLTSVFQITHSLYISLALAPP